MDIKALSKSIYLDFSEEEYKEVEKIVDQLNLDVEILQAIDTTNVEAMDLPFTLNENELRMDNLGEVMSSEELLSNAPDKSENFVRIVKVVS